MDQGHNRRRKLEEYILSLLTDDINAANHQSSRSKIEAALDLHTGSDAMIDILDRVADPYLAAYYLKNSLPDLQRESCNSWLLRSVSDRDMAFISILVKYRVRISHCAYKLVSAAMSAQDADFLAFLRAALGEHYIIIREIGSSRSIDQCTKNLAPFVEEELLHATPKEISSSLLSAGKDYLSLKTSMALMAINGRVHRENLDSLHPDLQRVRVKYPGPAGAVIINGWPSNLKEILSRAPEEAFFGFKERVTQSPRRKIKKILCMVP